MPEAVIIDAIRTPIGALGGVLSAVRPDDLAAHVHCWWPVQVPDGLTNHKDFDVACPNVARDWRNLKYD